MNKSVGFVVFLVGIALGAGGSYYYFGQGSSILGLSEETAGQVVSRLQESGYLFLDEPIGQSFVGMVENISGSTIKVSPNRPPVIDVILGKKNTLSIDVSNAEIVKQENRTPEELQEEQERLDQLAGGDQTQPFQIASPVKDVEASLSDIEMGALLVIAAGENVEGMTRIQAVRIVILP